MGTRWPPRTSAAHRRSETCWTWSRPARLRSPGAGTLQSPGLDAAHRPDLPRAAPRTCPTSAGRARVSPAVRVDRSVTPSAACRPRASGARPRPARCWALPPPTRRGEHPRRVGTPPPGGRRQRRSRARTWRGERSPAHGLVERLETLATRSRPRAGRGQVESGDAPLRHQARRRSHPRGGPGSCAPCPPPAAQQRRTWAEAREAAARGPGVETATGRREHCWPPGRTVARRACVPRASVPATSPRCRPQRCSLMPSGSRPRTAPPGWSTVARVPAPERRAGVKAASVRGARPARRGRVTRRRPQRPVPQRPCAGGSPRPDPPWGSGGLPTEVRGVAPRAAQAPPPRQAPPQTCWSARRRTGERAGRQRAPTWGRD